MTATASAAAGSSTAAWLTSLHTVPVIHPPHLPTTMSGLATEILPAPPPLPLPAQSAKREVKRPAPPPSYLPASDPSSTFSSAFATVTYAGPDDSRRPKRARLLTRSAVLARSRSCLADAFPSPPCFGALVLLFPPHSGPSLNVRVIGHNGRRDRLSVSRMKQPRARRRARSRKPGHEPPRQRHPLRTTNANGPCRCRSQLLRTMTAMQPTPTPTSCPP